MGFLLGGRDMSHDDWWWPSVITIQLSSNPQRCGVCGKNTAYHLATARRTTYAFCFDSDTCCRLTGHRLAKGMGGEHTFQGTIEEVRQLMLASLSHKEETVEQLPWGRTG